MEAYAYQTDRKNNIISSTRTNFTKLIDCINAKKESNDGVIAFVANIEAAKQEAVNTLLATNKMALYPTKKSEVFILGNQKREAIECEV